VGVHVRSFAPGDRTRVARLWEACGLTRPWNDPYRDIDRKLERDAELLLVGEAPASGAADGTTTTGRVVATVMAGYDGHRGWINYLAVDPDHRGEGHGRAMMEAAETRLLALGCPKVNLQVRTDNPDAVAFYEALGYSVDAVVSMGRRLITDD
jgi:ribosomal protein S18 acetylase RimI-like enzyme|tara:strand:- start:1650 stop:2108 length:459 start_codon:yes stop_codon:yes gene_type:complete